MECDFLLSSGSLVPLDVIDKVGGMEEELFIDQVDTEWCLRARSMGYRVFGAFGAILEHRLGEAHARAWFDRWPHLPATGRSAITTSFATRCSGMPRLRLHRAFSLRSHPT